MNTTNTTTCDESLLQIVEKIQVIRIPTLHYANVIDAINRNSDHCTEGGLSEFLEQTMDDFLNACENTEITDIRKYTKSLIWSSFSTYKVKLDAACLS